MKKTVFHSSSLERAFSVAMKNGTFLMVNKMVVKPYYAFSLRDM